MVGEMYRWAMVILAGVVVVAMVAQAYVYDDVNVISYKTGINSYAVIEQHGRRIILRGARAEEMLRRLGIIKNEPKVVVRPAPAHITYETNTVAENNTDTNTVVTRSQTTTPPAETPRNDALSRIEAKLDLIISILRKIAHALGVNV